MFKMESMVRSDFTNGDYARWIARYQQKNPDTISFSNDVDKLNNQGVSIVSLNPLMIKSGDASMEDIVNLGSLVEYFDYLVEKIGEPDRKSVSVLVGKNVYSVSKSVTNDKTVVRVIKVGNSGETDITVD